MEKQLEGTSTSSWKHLCSVRGSLRDFAPICRSVWNRFTTRLVTSVLKKQCSLDEANLVGPWPVLVCKGFFTRAFGLWGTGGAGAGVYNCPPIQVLARINKTFSYLRPWIIICFCSSRFSDRATALFSTILVAAALSQGNQQSGNFWKPHHQSIFMGCFICIFVT